jgi:membrane protein
MFARIVTLLKKTGLEWYDDEAPRLAASLACYALLSAAPLVMLCVTVAGFAFGEEAARGQIAAQIESVVGGQAANAIQGIASNAHQSDGGWISAVVGLGVLLFGASGVFGELQTSLNHMWDVKPKPGRGVKGFIRDRFFSFSMVLGVAFLLLVSMVVSAVLAALGRFLSGALPGGAALWQVLNFAISFGVITLLFGLIFKVVPDAKLRWRDVWVGAAFTALFFSLGKLLLGLYLGKSGVTSSYGAAGSIVALVVWVYYASQILFLGAEFTQVYARREGAGIEPNDNAVQANNPDKDDAPSLAATRTKNGAGAAA